MARVVVRAIALAPEYTLGNRGWMPVRHRCCRDDFQADDVPVFQVLIMSGSRALLVYLVLFTAAGVVAGEAYRLINWGHDVLGCILSRKPGTFLAYCTSDQYGDFEHGAYYFNLEPEAVGHLRTAKVLFLGNSRSQFGFSTDEVTRYFNERSIPFYLMGFGYGEGADFAKALIKKYNLKPKVLVVVTDPFFKSYLSQPASEIVADLNPFWKRVQARWDYVTKKIFNTVAPKVCDLRVTLCRSKSRSIYRASKDGSWIWRNLFTLPEYGQIPIDSGRVPIFESPGTTDLEIARQLFEEAGVHRDCVVLTAVPNSVIDTGPYALEIGRLLGVRVELPKLNGLVTIDTAHLTWTSAQRWSGSFLRGIDALVSTCVSDDRENAQGGSVTVPSQYPNHG
jgi:hypothetical protein